MESVCWASIPWRPSVGGDSRRTPRALAPQQQRVLLLLLLLLMLLLLLQVCHLLLLFSRFNEGAAEEGTEAVGSPYPSFRCCFCCWCSSPSCGLCCCCCCRGSSKHGRHYRARTSRQRQCHLLGEAASASALRRLFPVISVSSWLNTAPPSCLLRGFAAAQHVTRGIAYSLGAVSS